MAKFKVGDYVEVVGQGLASRGRRGRVVKVDESKKGWPYRVSFGGGMADGEYAEGELRWVPNSRACNGGWVGGPSLPGMRTIADYPTDPKSQRGVEFQKWLSGIDGKDVPSDWRALLTKKGYVVPNSKVSSTDPVVRRALNSREGIQAVKYQVKDSLGKAIADITMKGEQMKSFGGDLEAYQFAMNIVKKLKSVMASA